MNLFVLDASVALDWFLTKVDSCPSWDRIHLLDESAPVVPGIWNLEITNVLSNHVQRGRLTPDVARTVLAEMAALPAGVVDAGPPSLVMHLSVDHRLTSYDAAYLGAALRGDLPIATVDRELIRAAQEAGVAVL